MFGNWKDQISAGYEQLQENFSSVGDTLAAFSLDRLQDEEPPIYDIVAHQEQKNQIQKQENHFHSELMSSKVNEKWNTQEEEKKNETMIETNNRETLGSEILSYGEKGNPKRIDVKHNHIPDKRSDGYHSQNGNEIDLESYLSKKTSQSNSSKLANMYHRNARTVDSLIMPNGSPQKNSRIDDSNLSNDFKDEIIRADISSREPKSGATITLYDSQNKDTSIEFSPFSLDRPYNDGIDTEPETKRNSHLSEDEDKGDDITNYWTFNLIDKTKSAVLDNVRSISENFQQNNVAFYGGTNMPTFPMEKSRKERQNSYPRYQMYAKLADSKRRFEERNDKEKGMENEAQETHFAEEGLAIKSSNINYQDSSCVTKSLDDIFTAEEHEELSKFKKMSSTGKRRIPIMEGYAHSEGGIVSGLINLVRFGICSLFQTIILIGGYLFHCHLQNAIPDLVRALNQRLSTPEKKLNVVLIAMLVIVSCGMYRSMDELRNISNVF